MRRTQRPTTKSTPDKQKNGTDTGLKYSVLKYTIEPLSNKKHEQIIKEIKIKLRFIINYKSSCIYNKKTLVESQNTTSLCYHFNTKYSKIIPLLEKRYHFHS